ncbi:hypothetical protein D9M72_534750 [compost metagenome]
MDADTDERLSLEVVELQAAKSRRAEPLDVPPGQDRGFRVIFPDNGKIEDRHQPVAHLLVDDAVMRPDRLGAAVLKQADDFAEPDTLDALGQMGEAADVGKKNGRACRNVTLLLDVTEGAFADRADVRVHLAAGDAEGTKRQRQRPANGDRHVHLVPASAADPGVAAIGRLHGRGFGHGLRLRLTWPKWRRRSFCHLSRFSNGWNNTRRLPYGPAVTRQTGSRP